MAAKRGLVAGKSTVSADAGIAGLPAEGGGGSTRGVHDEVVSRVILRIGRPQIPEPGRGDAGAFARQPRRYRRPIAAHGLASSSSASVDSDSGADSDASPPRRKRRGLSPSSFPLVLRHRRRSSLEHVGLQLWAPSLLMAEFVAGGQVRCRWRAVPSAAPEPDSGALAPPRWPIRLTSGALSWWSSALASVRARSAPGPACPHPHPLPAVGRRRASPALAGCSGRPRAAGLRHGRGPPCSGGRCSNRARQRTHADRACLSRARCAASGLV